MTSKEFVIWLQGFSQGVHQYNITPMQWDILKAKLAEVNDGQPNFVTPPTPGITITNPPFGFGSTSTAYGYPSGSAWSYTNTGYNPPYTTGEGLDDIKIQHNAD
jgi:hypothetical protein